MNKISSIRSYSYRPSFYGSNTPAPAPQQDVTHLNTEVNELKKEHSKTRKALIGVSVVSALLVGGLLLRNHSLVKKANLNAETVKTKLKDALQKLKAAIKDTDNELLGDALDIIATMALLA